MDSVDHARDCENEAFGAFLIEAIAERIGMSGETNVKRIDRAIYKGTDCGAWIRFDAKGIMVGTIVEGSDAEFSRRIDLAGVGMDKEGAKLVADRTFAALGEAEEFSSEVWAETEAE